MNVKCYAVLDAKVAQFKLCIFDLADEGAMRQFSDVISEKANEWHKHPEDYSLWYVGYFDTVKGSLIGELPVNLVNAVAIISLNKPPDIRNNGDKIIETVAS